MLLDHPILVKKPRDRIEVCHIPLILCIEKLIIIYKRYFQFIWIKIGHDPFQYCLGIFLTWGHDVKDFTCGLNEPF